MVTLTPDEVAAVVLARQNRRVGVVLLGAVTVFLWVLAAAWTAFFWMMYNNMVTTNLDAILHDPVPDQVAGFGAPAAVTQQQRMGVAAYRLGRGLWWASLQLGGIAATTLAAQLSTITLVWLSRRATLNQVRAVLADISAQLAALNQAGRPASV